MVKHSRNLIPTGTEAAGNIFKTMLSFPLNAPKFSEPLITFQTKFLFDFEDPLAF